MPKYKEKRVPISGTASTTPAPAGARQPKAPSARMTESVPRSSRYPNNSEPLPRRTFDDQKRVDKVYRWK